MKSEKDCSLGGKLEEDDWLQTCLTSFDAATGIRVRFAKNSEPPLPPEGRPTFCRLLHVNDPASVTSCARFHAESREEASRAKCAIRRECPCGINLLWAPVTRQDEFYGFLETEPLIVVPDSGRVNQVDGVLLVLRLLADHIARGFKQQELFAPAASASLALAHRAEQYMRLHFTDPLSTSDLAKELHVSEQHLCRAFRHETGETILQFLGSLRVNWACELLEAHPELTVAEIALASGFQSIPRFYTVFHALTEKSPTHWREEHTSP
jgi:AraC-like DNA-binding protein